VSGSVLVVDRTVLRLEAEPCLTMLLLTVKFQCITVPELLLVCLDSRYCATVTIASTSHGSRPQDELVSAY